MQINIGLQEFKINHTKKKHQILFRSLDCRNYYKIENLYKFLLAEKNSFIFESVEKGTVRGRYTIIGLNPDKIWDFNMLCYIKYKRKKVKMKVNPLKYLNKLIENFKIKYLNRFHQWRQCWLDIFARYN